jgi:chloride channel 3/4/5
LQDLLTEMNSYPFLNNKHKPIFTSDLADIVPRVRKERIIDITNSPVVPAPSLRTKLELLHKAGELDGGLPIVRDGILVGLIPAPDLEYALDNLPDEANSLCLMAQVQTIEDSDGDGDGDGRDPTDFTPYIDPVSRFLHHHMCPRRLMGVNDRVYRHRLHWILDLPWIWCTSVSSSWA